MRRCYVERSKDRPKAHAQLKAFSPEAFREFLVRGSSETFHAARERFLRTNGICCFAERHDDLLMWGHYGGSYTGCCLEFRTDCEPFHKLLRVKYEDKIPAIDLAPFAIERDAKQIVDLYCTKSRMGV